MRRKIESADLFNCDKLDAFLRTVIVSDRHLRGYSESYFYTCSLDNVPFFTKLTFYPIALTQRAGRASAPAVMSQPDTEIKVLEHLYSAITAKDYSPCILELIYHKVCTDLTRYSHGDCSAIPGRHASTEASFMKLLCRKSAKVAQGLLENKFAFLVLDKCELSLRGFLAPSAYVSVHTAIFKSILFQIIYTLYCITRVYPDFRHGDLHAENIMLKLDPTFKFVAGAMKYQVFTVGDVSYNVPYFGITPKIIDFGFASIPSLGIVSDITLNPYYEVKRPHVDIVQLFYWINRMLKMTGNTTDVNNTGGITNILRTLEPSQSYIKHKNMREYKGNNVEVCGKMLSNEIWAEYRGEITTSQIYHKYAAMNL